MSGTYPFEGGPLKVVFDYPTFTVSIPTASITSTSAEEILALELYPAFFNNRMRTQPVYKIKIMNWHRCTDNTCVKINDETTQGGKTPKVGTAGYFLHVHTDVMGPILWHYVEGVNHYHIPIIPSKTRGGKRQLVRYGYSNRLQYNHSMPLKLDMDQPSGSVDVDTRVECSDLLDYSQQYFTKPTNTKLLRSIRRRLKEGNASDLEEIQFSNVLYHKVHGHVNKLKRLRIDITNENYELGVTDSVSFPPGSKSMVVLTFQPRRKKLRIANEHSFQINCNQLFKMGLTDVWLTNQMWTVHDNEMWPLHLQTYQPAINVCYLVEVIQTLKGI